jgi:hypothetical protein
MRWKELLAEFGLECGETGTRALDASESLSRRGLLPLPNAVVEVPTLTTDDARER